MGKEERHSAGGGGGSFCPSPSLRHFHVSYQFQPHRQKYAITAWAALPTFFHSSRIIISPGIGLPFISTHVDSILLNGKYAAFYDSKVHGALGPALAQVALHCEMGCPRPQLLLLSLSLPALCFFHQKFSWRFLREGEGGEMKLKQDPGESEMDAGGCSDEMI